MALRSLAVVSLLLCANQALGSESVQALLPQSIQALDEQVGVVVPLLDSFFVYVKKDELMHEDPQTKLSLYAFTQPSKKIAMWGTYDVASKSVEFSGACNYERLSRLNVILSAWHKAGYEYATMDMVIRICDIDVETQQKQLRFLREAKRWLKGSESSEAVMKAFHQLMGLAQEDELLNPEFYNAQMTTFKQQVRAEVEHEEQTHHLELVSFLTDEEYRRAKYWLSYQGGKITLKELEAGLGPNPLAPFYKDRKRLKNVLRGRFTEYLREKVKKYEQGRNSGSWYVDRALAATSKLAYGRLHALNSAVMQKIETGHYVHSEFYDSLPTCPTLPQCKGASAPASCEVYPLELGEEPSLE